MRSKKPTIFNIKDSAKVLVLKGFHRYMDYKIRVCGKDSIPLQDFRYLVENQVFSEKCANAKSVRTIINYTF